MNAAATDTLSRLKVRRTVKPWQARATVIALRRTGAGKLPPAQFTRALLARQHMPRSPLHASSMQRLSPPLELVPQSIEVYLLNYSDDEVLWHDLRDLSTKERQHARRLVRMADRVRFVKTRAHVRRYLGAILGCAARNVPLANGPFGKPFVSGLSMGPVFNVSHSGSYGLLAFASGRDVRSIGIDIEQHSSELQLNEVANLAFGPLERSLISRATHPSLSFYDHWTGKEAVLKALALGITQHLQSFQVTFSTEGRIAIEGNPAGWPKLQAVQLSLFEGYASALAWSE